MANIAEQNFYTSTVSRLEIKQHIFKKSMRSKVTNVKKKNKLKFNFKY